MQRAMLKYPTAFFMDIGSNLGLYGLTIAKMGYHVFAFEPFFQNRVRICKSVALNKMGAEGTGRFHLFRKGAGNARRKNTFSGHDNGNMGGISLNNARDEGDKSFTPETEGIRWAETFRIDDYLDVYSHYGFERGHAVVLKLDIEGLECEAVEGMQAFFQTFSAKYVMMEWNQMTGDAAKLRLHHLDHFCETMPELIQTLQAEV